MTDFDNDILKRLTELSVENDSLRQQLTECQAREDYYRAALEMYIMPMPDKDTTVMDVLLASTEAAMEALALPSDSTALDTLLKQAKREALLEAATAIDNCPYGRPISVFGNMAELVRNMAKELE